MHEAANAWVVLVMAALAWRLLTAPLLVRFAHRKKLGDLRGAGLSIGRDACERLTAPTPLATTAHRAYPKRISV